MQKKGEKIVLWEDPQLVSSLPSLNSSGSGSIAVDGSDQVLLLEVFA